MKSIICLSVMLFVAGSAAWAQAPQSPEVNQLQPLVGKWTCDFKDHLAGKEGRNQVDCAWEKGGDMVTCREYQLPGSGPLRWLMSFAYDARAKTYKRVVLGSNGFAVVFSGSVKAGKYDFAGNGEWQGKPAKFEFKMEPGQPPGALAFVNRVSIAGAAWQVNGVGKCIPSK